MTAKARAGQLKVFFRLPRGGWHGFSAESVWATPIDATGRVLRVDNIPAYVKGVSRGDVVRAGMRAGALWFREVIEKSGHSTVRVLIEDAKKRRTEVRARLAQLTALHCVHEGMVLDDLQLHAIDIPPTASIADVYEIIEGAHDAGIWDTELGDESPVHSTQMEEE